MSDIPKLSFHVIRLSMVGVFLLIASLLHAQAVTQNAAAGQQNAAAGQQNAAPGQQNAAPGRQNAAGQQNAPEEGEVFRTVLVLFMLAVVLESALALLFNWRPFVETFNSRAVRPIVSLVVAYLFVWKFDLDLMTTIVNASVPTSPPRPPGRTGMLLTAMVLAGGSAAVNNVLVGLGFRQRRTPETITPKPPPDKAWIAVRIVRQNVVGPVKVFLGPPPTGGEPHPPIVTIIHGTSHPKLRYFLNDRGRFPGSGGYTVKADSVVQVDVVGVDSSNQEISKTWGPHKVAGDAIIDLDFEM